MKLKLGSFLVLPLLLATVFVTGCAGVHYTLKPEQLAKVNRTEVRAYLPDKGIQAQFIQSSYGAGGGLIGAVIDAGVTAGHKNSAVQRVQRLRDQVSDLDIAAIYWSALSNAVCSVPWLKVESFTPLPERVRPVKSKDVAAGAVLNLGSDFILSQDCKVFIMDTGMGFFVPGHAGHPSAVNIVTYQSAEVGPAAGTPAIDLWTADGAAAFRRTVREAAEENARIVRHALEVMGNASATSPKPARIKVRLMHAAGDFGVPFGKVALKGDVLEDASGRLIFRNRIDGHILSLPRAEVDVEYLNR